LQVLLYFRRPHISFFVLLQALLSSNDRTTTMRLHQHQIVAGLAAMTLWHLESDRFLLCLELYLDRKVAVTRKKVNYYDCAL